MTVGQRELLEKFSGGTKPLNKAIAAVLHEVDRLRAKPPEKCEVCGGTGLYRGISPCRFCRGTGRQP